MALHPLLSNSCLSAMPAATATKTYARLNLIEVFVISEILFILNIVSKTTK